MTDDELMAVLREAASAVAAVLDGLPDWGLAGTRDGQHHSDLVADKAALPVLLGAGLSVLSEESGRHDQGSDVTVVVDPVDGSTNAALGLPWYATSLCAVDSDGPRAALVANLASEQRFEATRGGGATLDGQSLTPTTTTSLADAVVSISGFPPHHLGWRQFRTYGALALDLCAVAAGQFDALIDTTRFGHSPWDYLGGLLVCIESGAAVGEGEGRDLVTLEGSERRIVLAAATPQLLEESRAARAEAFNPASRKPTPS